ncbi:DNA alkylation repair protein [Shimazuella kribbensis]|uniref:DNA alkylation repair protein n=1 Tax=Shimazuella kribbensis TaxID=139808 RepID=UPI00041B5A69|nr:DNA alkylation repair protein [Shimazuella kribbensis]
MEQLKNIYNERFVDQLNEAIYEVYPSFDRFCFHRLIFQEDWEGLALKQRMRRITEALFEGLPKEYQEALGILYHVAPRFRGLSGIVFPDYVEQYGLDDWDQSMVALATFTPFSTAEYAVRPFLLKDQEKMLTQMLEWSTHPNEHLRRLASEGCRPRLPWGVSIPSLKTNPYPILPILTNLKQDASLYVRKSVANNLNDISKTYPDLVLELANVWYGKNEHTDWIIKHACRTLLKRGDTKALSLFGYHDESNEILHFRCDLDQVDIGGKMEFSFDIQAKSDNKMRVEYAIDFVKGKGKRNKKVFKVTEIQIRGGETKSYTKTHSFRDLTTRKHYPGVHTLTIIINGIGKASYDFVLK